eukprot:TRINITY_DN43019_c0_g1_i1.p1 TRINITY_DN43019_c0_g1~~TRINITY_DN43019_c0_g1_i1.p1  ORF type:complete len:672 (+),score=142.82 TRINITY_DN43019_c0_g1_i1:114-2129(+)
MALAEPLRGCLETLTDHCRALQVENDVLLQETKRLKQQLAAPLDEQPMRPDVPAVPAPELWPSMMPGSLQFQNHPGEVWVTPVDGCDERQYDSIKSKQASGQAGDVMTTPEERSENGRLGDAWVTPRDQVSGGKQEQRSPPEQSQPGLRVSGTRNLELLHVRTMGAARLGMNEESTPCKEPEEEEQQSGMCRQIIHELFNDNENGQKHTTVSFLEKLVQSLAFRIACLVLIVINSIFTGVRMDSELRSSLERFQGGSYKSNNTFFYIEIVFTIWFILELLLRILAERRMFVFGENRSYNLMDSVLILLSVADMFLPGLPSASFLRLFRAFRIVRIARLVQSISALKPLRTMLFAIVNSFPALCWAFFMITLTFFVFSIFIGGAVLALFEDCDIAQQSEVEKAMMLAPYFGNLYLTMVTLFASITGGDDWMTAARHLRLLKDGEFYFAVYCCFIFFSLIGLLNVVNGIFVDSAVCTRTEDEVVQHFRDDEHRTSEEIRRIFQQSDTDASGSITLEELQLQIKNPWVKAYFAGLDIDPREASIIFNLLDTDCSGELSLDEFITGILKMKGSAKGVDALAIMFDHQRLALSFNALCSYLEDQLSEIKEAVKPGCGRGDTAIQLVDTLAALDRGAGKYIDAFDQKDAARTSPLIAVVPRPRGQASTTEVHRPSLR